MAQPACCTLQFPSDPTCCDLSPSGPLLAAGLVTGEVQLHRWSEEASSSTGQMAVQTQSLWSRAVHTADQSCRAVRWLPTGDALVSGGLDTHLVATSADSGKEVWRIDSAHSAGISLVYPTSASFSHAPFVVSGDQDGGLKIWDIRTRQQAMSFKKHTDFISDATLHTKDYNLVVTSGDGTLSVHDLRTCKYKARSESDADDELLSVAVLRGGKKVVAGSGSGVLFIYSWGYFNDCSDRFPGHPESVDALIVWDDSTLLTGSSDGMIRVVNILPNKLLGVVGAHEDMPIESLALSYDRRLLASTSHDDTVRLWDLSILEDDSEDEQEPDHASDDDPAPAVAGDLNSNEEPSEAATDEDEAGLSEDVSLGSDDTDSESSGSEQDSEQDGEGEGEEGSDQEAEEGSDQDGPSKAGTSKADHDVPAQESDDAPGRSRQAEKGAKKSGLAGKGGPQQGKGTGTGSAAGVDAQGDSDSSEDEQDSDDEGKGKKGKRKRERTRWTKEQNKRGGAGAGGNFFADLL